jgi:hypothetical protein
MLFGYCPKPKRKVRKVKRYNVSGSVCNKKKKKSCKSDKRCSWTKRRGCSMRKGPKGNSLKAIADLIANESLNYAKQIAAVGGTVEEQSLGAASRAEYICQGYNIDPELVTGVVMSFIRRKGNSFGGVIDDFFGFFKQEPKRQMKNCRMNDHCTLNCDIYPDAETMNRMVSNCNKNRPSFGKKRKSKKSSRSPKLLRLCKKYKIKMTYKLGKKRFNKPVSLLKKQLKRKMKR